MISTGSLLAKFGTTKPAFLPVAPQAIISDFENGDGDSFFSGVQRG